MPRWPTPRRSSGWPASRSRGRPCGSASSVWDTLTPRWTPRSTGPRVTGTSMIASTPPRWYDAGPGVGGTRSSPRNCEPRELMRRRPGQLLRRSTPRSRRRRRWPWVGNLNRERDLLSNAARETLLSDAETQMKETGLEAKEEAHRIRLSLGQEVRDARAELQRSESRVQQKEESIDRKLEDLDRKEQGITQKELEIGRTRERVNDALAEQVKELERISGMTRAEARTTIITNLEKELNQEIA